MTRLPQLEQELVAAAARLQSPRRIVAPALRVVLAAGAAALAVIAVGIVIAGNGGEPGREAAAPAAFPPDAQLEDVMGIFREPATPADRVSYAPGDPRLNTDRQPGEEPSRSRRVDWPGEEIYVWPMRDGVCYGVRSGSGCVPLGHLRRVGVSVGIQSGRLGQFISGVVVDGIDEVVLTSPGGPDQRVPVRENFVFASVDAGAKGIRWTYAGEERSLDIAQVTELIAPPLGTTDEPGAPDGAPRPSIDSIAESASPPLDFVMGGVAYRAVGFQTTRSALCVRLTEVDAGVPGSTGCLGGRGLRETLAEKPVTIFTAGGTLSGDMVHAGFVRPDVVEVTPRDKASGVTVVLSEPWRPEPWEGEPIRFLLAVDLGSGLPEPGEVSRVELNARLKDGRVLPIR
jgi:hypothetical protein